MAQSFPSYQELAARAEETLRPFRQQQQRQQVAWLEAALVETEAELNNLHQVQAMVPEQADPDRIERAVLDIHHRWLARIVDAPVQPRCPLTVNKAIRHLTKLRKWLYARLSPAPAADAEIQPRATADETPNIKPVAASKQVQLFGPGEKPKVKRKWKAQLSTSAYDVVCALIRAGENGLTKDKLDNESGHGDARKMMKRLADKDRDWKSVLVFPGKPGRGYRIR